MTGVIGSFDSWCVHEVKPINDFGMTAGKSDRWLNSGRNAETRKANRASILLTPFVGASAPFWVLAAFLIAEFTLGGSARGDIESLILLRPASIMTLGFGLRTLRSDQISAYRWLFGISALCVVLAVVQLLPLPLQMLYSLPGREVVAEINRASGQSHGWQPMTLTYSYTWNALWAMMAPLAVLTLCVQLSSIEQTRLLGLILLLGLGSAALAMVQMWGDPNGPQYLYDDSGHGLPIGLLANRNHQATLLCSLLPMLAVWAKLGNRKPQVLPGAAHSARLILAGLTGLMLFPIILLTGSRAGTVSCLLMLLSTPVLSMGHPLRANARFKEGKFTLGPNLLRMLPFLVLLIGAGLIAVMIWLGRAESVNRLLGSDPLDDLRFKILPTMRMLIATNWPFGSGLGSFKPVYRIAEAGSVIAPTIMNHAHNEWLEIIATGGAPLVLIVAVCVYGWVSRSVLSFRPSHGHEQPEIVRLGLIVILLFAGASITDYPLRVPSLSCLIMVVAIWAARPRMFADDNGGGVIASISPGADFRET